MTVKELIDELKCYEQDKEVWFKDSSTGLYGRVDVVDLEGLDEDFVVLK